MNWDCICGFLYLEMLKVNVLNNSFTWPKINKNILIKNEINFVVQINGKTRGVLKIKKGLNEKELLQKINENEKISNHLKDKSVKKTIFIANRLINILL